MSWWSRIRSGWGYRRAWESEQAGRLAEARAIYEKAADGSSGELQLASLVRAGMIATGAGDLLEARKLFERAVKAAPADATAWLHYANACFRLLDTPAADEAYHEALKHAPGRPDILYHQAVYYGDRMAKAGLQAARRAGMALFDLLDRPGGPVKVADLNFNPDLPALYVRNFSLEKQLVDDGVEILREFAARPGGPATSPSRCSSLNHLGLLLANAGRYDEALKAYDAAMKEGGELVEFRFNRGMTHLRRHAWEEAKRDFAAWAKRFPASPVTSFASAILAETRGELKEAERLYRFFLERVEKTPVAPSELARIDIARTWIEHARVWIEAASKPGEGGIRETDPGVEGGMSDRPRGT